MRYGATVATAAPPATCWPAPWPPVRCKRSSAHGRWPR
ncbi:MAG: hypothetical protein JNL05_11140 [Flavobacteriales bacterium]|nr:hypothetical protein [Flavobacteriales bacterium]